MTTWNRFRKTIEAWLARMAAANRAEFGSQSPSCCTTKPKTH